MKKYWYESGGVGTSHLRDLLAEEISGHRACFAVDNVLTALQSCKTDLSIDESRPDATLADIHCWRRAAVLYMAGYSRVRGCVNYLEYLVGTPSFDWGPKQNRPDPIAKPPSDINPGACNVLLVDSRVHPCDICPWLGIPVVAECRKTWPRMVVDRQGTYWLKFGWKKIEEQHTDLSLGEAIDMASQRLPGMTLEEGLAAFVQRACCTKKAGSVFFPGSIVDEKVPNLFRDPVYESSELGPWQIKMCPYDYPVGKGTWLGYHAERLAH